MAWTASIGRSHFDCRRGVVFHDAGSLRKQLEEVADSADEATPRGRRARIAFAYTGQGSQWTGMGRELYEQEPVARAVLDRCEAVFLERRGTSLLDVMFARGDASEDLGDTAWEQPALYALECALTALWWSVGVRPSAVVGHSAGELAAAQAAGVFSLEDGMHFSQARGTALSSTSPGAMAAVFAPPARVESAVETLNQEIGGVGLSVSADNGLHQVVSGPVEAIEAITVRLKSEGVRVQRLNTTRAFHSALVEPALDTLEAALDDVAISPPHVDVISNLTGRVVEPGTMLDGAYWRRHARERVSFGDTVRTLADLGVDLVIEIGPRSLLAPLAVSAWPDSAPPPRVIASMGLPDEEKTVPGSARVFADAVAEAYEAGLSIRFQGLFAGESCRRIPIPDYPFQRERFWLETSKRRRRAAGHPLLGVRHASASGEISYETDVSASEPAWLADHRVYGQVVAPGALYGAMAASASRVEGSERVALEDIQLHNALVISDEGEEDAAEEGVRAVQVLLGAPDSRMTRQVQVFSRGRDDEWMLHMEGRATNAPTVEGGTRVDLEGLISGLSPLDTTTYYRARAETGIHLGPPFRTLQRIWRGPGEALAEVSLPETSRGSELDIHPLLLDGCFQVVGAARGLDGTQGQTTYLPFAWERFWLSGPLPERMFCHVRMKAADRASDSESSSPPEVQSGDLCIYDPSGVQIGGLSDYAVKRATRAALLSSIEGIDDLLYEVTWQERALPPGVQSADFFPEPAEVKARARLLPDYLRDAGVEPKSRNALLADLESWSHSFAIANLDRLGWVRTVGDSVRPEELRETLNVAPEHERLFRRMLEMAARAGVLAEDGNAFVVRSGSGDAWPAAIPEDPESHADEMAARYPHGLTEIGLFRRSGGALADVLRGRNDPLTLLFSSGEPTAADLYLRAPVARAANQMLSEAVRSLVATLPPGRRLRLIEIGAGTGSATAALLPELPEGRFDYMYTDISAGFFSEAEARFGDGGGCIEYRPLDIEKDPIEQGFDLHGYDIAIASNVLHATRYLEETLAHCCRLLAPSGHLVALENLRGLGWMDLTFGQLDGWWRFADDFRPHHALASPAVWRRALGNTGFEAVEVLGVDESDPPETMDKGVIVAKGPVRVQEAPGIWVLTANEGGLAEEIAGQLAARNQTVVLAGTPPFGDEKPATSDPGVRRVSVDADQRDSWRILVERLAPDLPFKGVVHCTGLDGHGAEATTEELMEDVRRAGTSALALIQGVSDSDRTPELGVWFLTRGAQVLERERGGSIAGAVLWGFGKAVDREAAHLSPRMIDLDPTSMAPTPDLANELLYPDTENHIAYRLGRRQVARLVRAGDGQERLDLPEQSEWVLAPDQGGAFDRPSVQPLPARALEAQEVRVGVDAAGLNFWDVFRSLGFIQEGLLGREMCGRILEKGSDVCSVSVGDRVVGLGFGAFGPQMITREELVAPAPEGYSVSDLATVPSAFVSAALSFELSGLKPGERVLIHAGAGGVGLAAIQLVVAAGAEVFATASSPKQAYLRSLGVNQLFDSRTTEFADQILEATGGEGVDVVLNSLTSEGFIDASLSCLKQGGRFVELARRDILSEEEMSALRPDVGYDILELDVLKKTDPAWVGRVLTDIVNRLGSGELTPIVHSRWPLSEAGAALRFMRSARHLGKIVATASPLARGHLQSDRSYLVTGGLGGIGCAVAVWLADRGAGTIVLNGRRDPDADARETIHTLRERGVNVFVELADATDTAAIDRMLDRIDRSLPPLAGVIHSVGVLSDGALTNQSWTRFEQVLWPKILAAWHLHRATESRDLDFFMLFSSRVGVMGNPGQANHAAANAFLDQLAAHRRAMGLPGQAIAWGAWSEIGEAAEQKDRIERQRSALGGRWFTPQQGLKAMERLMREDVATSVVMSMDWTVFEEAVEERPAFLEELLSSDAETEDERSSSSTDVLTRLGETPASERVSLLVSFLQGEVQAVLRLPSTPDPSVGFFDLGMDSLMSVELRNRLNRAFAGNYTTSNTVVFDYPDIDSLARHLVEELGDVDVEETAPQALPEPIASPAPQNAVDGIAIVGMACRFPGAPDLASFRQLLAEGRSTITEGRPDSVGGEGVSSGPATGGSAYRHGAFIEGIDRFDARFFGIQPIEARTMDPRQRILLETTWQALEDAGIDPGTLRGGRVGVYAGLGGSEYRDLVALDGGEVGYLGTAGSVAVGRVAFALGLSGPAMALDMTCASSLAALHQAAVGLERGEVDVALGGGVHAVLSPGVTTFMSELGLLSKGGRCRPFDADADGFVRGEGCGMVVLKRLADAEADGDRIWAVIRGSAVNQSGASAGLTVPNGPAQERVIEEALSRADIAPSDVDYLEAHGTGSAMGDPIEVRAVAAVYGKGRDPERPLLIGSFKPNIGHPEAAAGIAGLIKVLLAMQDKLIPPQPDFQTPSPLIEWDKVPVQVTSKPTPWPLVADRPPRAGISAFGISGANAHVVVEGYDYSSDASSPAPGMIVPAGAERPVPFVAPDPAGGPVDAAVTDTGRRTRLLPLSGKSNEALRELAMRYLSWLKEAVVEVNADAGGPDSFLSDMAWTTSVGRSHFVHRAGVVFQDAPSLREHLETLGSSQDGPATETPTRIAFAFSGDIGTWAGTGEALYRSEPVFRAVLERCEAAFQDLQTQRCSNRCAAGRNATPFSTILPGVNLPSTRWNALLLHCGPASA
ncbi:MAG: SDR family NAD(P)-dependent oxidoreductase [bacterium]|nr:SDR family NAD(P)-dependent oxidoreductase [bacterium]